MKIQYAQPHPNPPQGGDCHGVDFNHWTNENFHPSRHCPLPAGGLGWGGLVLTRFKYHKINRDKVYNPRSAGVNASSTWQANS